ncbi:phospholipid/cholesterol/gamma-HCH transport system substrate-binding protein [Nocardioides albertanoniae]|uniref:Phospholipid/cholesterol/gamma-HCH transport system substrate-binding protein n=1 Tax=Nocardioides albertanoniae TaxID=1175486 RepID=A0A543A2N2_9ACTN|nr:MlaD family protein [Nocardioides albertanoniae]TQL66820.1 phospholipid/cholesterol/gamma-HCH transport system substrate-binding protein [Nocardioides albertanoniae]
MQRLTGGVRVKLGLFVALALVGTSYVGARYVGLDLLDDPYQVEVSLPEGGGLFVNSEVTYRGVPVGEVTSLEAKADGVRALLEIKSDAPAIPADVTVKVANRSAIGEQYLDMRGGAVGSDHLSDGDRLSAGEEALPYEAARVIESGRDLVASVPQDALKTTIDESYLLSQGAGSDLRRLIDTSTQFHQEADESFLVSASLIRNSGQVLETQEESAASIKAWSNDLSLFSDTLADSDKDLRDLIGATPGATQEVSRLVKEVGGPLGILMSNLVTPAQLFGTNAAALESTFVTVPEAVSIGWAVNSSKGLRLSLMPSFFNPLPCVSGYQGTDLRAGTDVSKGKPFNTAAGCDTVPKPKTVKAKTAEPRTVTVPETLAGLMGE